MCARRRKDMHKAQRKQWVKNAKLRWGANESKTRTRLKLIPNSIRVNTGILDTEAFMPCRVGSFRDFTGWSGKGWSVCYGIKAGYPPSIDTTGHV